MTHTFTYYGWFGPGDSSDDIEYEAEVSEKEKEVLEVLEREANGEPDRGFDKKAYIEENQKLLDDLAERIQAEIEELEAEENYPEYDDEDSDEYESENEMPDICVRWPW